MAKVQIKSEKLTLFEGFFSIMELFVTTQHPYRKLLVNKA